MTPSSRDLESPGIPGRFTSHTGIPFEPESVLSIDKPVPFLRRKRRISRETLRHDLLAGLTGAIVVLPQGVAFATFAGLPPQANSTRRRRMAEHSG